MKIRAAKDDDYAAMARLRRQTIRAVNSKDYPDAVIRSWSARIGAQDLRQSAETHKRWVALDKGQIIGFCEHDHTGELSRIYVHKNHLRKGVGSRLLEVAEHSLAKRGCNEIRVESTVHEEDNAPAYKMRKRLR
jgi:putative acetyltransferase